MLFFHIFFVNFYAELAPKSMQIFPNSKKKVPNSVEYGAGTEMHICLVGPLLLIKNLLFSSVFKTINHALENLSIVKKIAKE